MSEDKAETKAKDEPAPGMTSTSEGVETNHAIGQTPDQFYDGDEERRKADAHVPANHATKGMTVLGYTEASRIENSADDQERDRKVAEKAARKD